jgi:hypothetical protein
MPVTVDIVCNGLCESVANVAWPIWGFHVVSRGMMIWCRSSSRGGVAIGTYWGPEHPRTGGWSLLAVMSDWQRGVDWLLVEYCRCRLQLDLRWCRWRASAKGLCLAEPPSSGETSRLGLRDPVASGVKCGSHGVKKSKTKSWTEAGVG